MGLRPTQGDESRCHPEPFAVTLSEAKGLQFARSQGKLREGSVVPIRGELMQILRFAQNDVCDFQAFGWAEGPWAPGMTERFFK